MLMGGIFIIVFAGLGMAYSRQTQEQTRLAQEVAQVQLILAKSLPAELSSEKDELEKRLAQSQPQLEALKASLSPVVQSIEASDALFDIAETCGVEVVGSRSTRPSVEALNGVGYSTLCLNVRVEGDVTNIIRFIHTWTEENLTGVVKSVSINVPEITGEEAEETTGEGEISEEEEPVGEGEGEELGETGEEEEPTGEEEGAEEAETEQRKPSADIELIIYTYQGG